jgi:hypothetical protein
VDWSADELRTWHLSQDSHVIRHVERQQNDDAGGDRPAPVKGRPRRSLTTSVMWEFDRTRQATCCNSSGRSGTASFTLMGFVT